MIRLSSAEAVEAPVDEQRTALLEGIVLLQERIRNEDPAERWRGDPIVVS